MYRMLGHEKEEWGHLGTKSQLRRFTENILWPEVNFIELDKFYLDRYIDMQAVYACLCAFGSSAFGSSFRGWKRGSIAINGTTFGAKLIGFRSLLYFLLYYFGQFCAIKSE